MLRPTSGNFLGPKTRAATPAITTSSGTPSPNKALQVRPLFLFLLTDTLTLFTLALFNNKVDKDEEKPTLTAPLVCVVGIGIGIEEHEEDKETAPTISIFGFSCFSGFSSPQIFFLIIRYKKNLTLLSQN